MGFSNRPKLWLIVALLLGGVLGYSAGTFQAGIWERDFFESVRPLRVANPSYPLVHRLLAYEVPEATILPEYAELKRKVEAHVDSALGKGEVEKISVYYRNLESGRWIGLNENEAYYPASLLKVPLLIAYFKARETDSALFGRRVVYDTMEACTEYEASPKLVPGRSYSVGELIERMIVDSDNGATYTLFDNIDPDLLARVYERLGIEDPGDDSSTYKIPTQTYALFFRTLYNGTYLRASDSEEALEILARVSYRDGLVTGVPEGTTVAHKFGEHVVAENGAPVGEELHDCGIIYKPGRPYLLCVMTKAKTPTAAADLIRSVSQLVYENESGN